MIQIYKNILDESQIKELSNFFYEDNISIMEGSTQRSKHPVWDVDVWPQNIIDNVLKRVLPNQSYDVEETWFGYSFKAGRGVHIDSNSNSIDKNWLVVLIPLEFVGASSTIFFENYYYGTNSRFSHEKTTNKTITDYSLIENYDSKLKFNESVHKKYMEYINIDDLHGLTLDTVYEWKTGEAVVFERYQLHAQGFVENYKLSVIILVNKK
jgi:hypothetical protein